MKKLYSQIIYGLGRNLRKIFSLCVVSSLVFFGCSSIGLDGGTELDGGTGSEESIPDFEITQFGIEIHHPSISTSTYTDYYSYYGNIEEKIITIHIPDSVFPNIHEVRLLPEEMLFFPNQHNPVISDPLGPINFSKDPSNQNVFLSSITVSAEGRIDEYKLRLIQHPSEIEDTIYIFQRTQLTSASSAIRMEVQSSKRYELMNPIVLQGTFYGPIGDYARSFGGTFDGRGNTISNLNIKRGRDTSGSKGLFGNTSPNAVIRNLHLHISDAVNHIGVDNEGSIGYLVGYNEGLIENVSITGDLRFEHRSGNTINYGTGSLVGNNAVDGTIENSHMNGSIDIRINTLDGDRDAEFYNVGGLVGINSGNIRNSSVKKAIIEGRGDLYGGLVGDNKGGTIENSHVRSVSIEGINYSMKFGGLVGKNTGEISKSSAVGTITGWKELGGLVGHNLNGSITESYAEVNVFASGISAGGLVGRNQHSLRQDGNATITSSYATGYVEAERHSGGLVGAGGGGIIRGSYASGLATLPLYRYSDVGGLVGSISTIDSTNTSIAHISSSYFNDQQPHHGWGGIGSISEAAENNYNYYNFISVQGYSVIHGRVYQDYPLIDIRQSDFVDDDPSDEYDMWNFDTTWHWIGDGIWPRLKWEYDE